MKTTKIEIVEIKKMLHSLLDRKGKKNEIQFLNDSEISSFIEKTIKENPEVTYEIYLENKILTSISKELKKINEK